MKIKTVDEVIRHFKGKGGDDEAECILIDNNSERKDGWVSVWGCNHNIAKVAERCRNSIIKIDGNLDGVTIHIDRKAFRGVVYAFRRIK